MYWIIGVLVSFAILEGIVTSDYPLVALSKNGKIRGTFLPGFQIKEFEAFMGIPYAKPPVGDLRFANPVPVDPIVGTFSATAPRADCIQKNYLLTAPIVSGEEDCLYLNIYRPVGVSPNKTVPVMVYIYGGGFFSGSANPVITGPEYFMDTQRVIVVTMAYRLGAFGFLSTGDDSSPGNFALKDQRTALQWVHKHIRKFGGRPDAVTIFGQSAGGASVHMHMLSSRSQNIFQRAIIMSGNAGAPYNDYIKDPLAQARKQAEYVGISNPDQMSTRELISKLRKINALDLVHSGDKFKYWHVDPLVTFRPVVEKNLSTAFITVDPKVLIRTGNYHQIPWMVTMVPFEGAVRALSIMSNDTLLKQFNDNFEELLTKLMEIPTKSKYQRSQIVERLVNQYLNGSRYLTRENANGLGQMISGRAFTYPLYKTVKQYVEYADIESNPIYLSKFSYRGNLSYSMLFAGNMNDYGVVHCDDLISLLHSPLLFSEPEKNSSRAKITAEMVDNFVTFAYHGQPNNWESVEPCTKDVFCPGLNEKRFCDIQEFKNSPHNSYDYQISITKDFDFNEILFWDKLLK